MTYIIISFSIFFNCYVLLNNFNVNLKCRSYACKIYSNMFSHGISRKSGIEFYDSDSTGEFPINWYIWNTLFMNPKKTKTVNKNSVTDLTCSL